MNFRKNIYAISIVAVSAAILSVTGCGITPQDEGLGASSSKAVSGIVVDGYLAGATVYFDVNENNRLDAWEARALTDTEGYYSYNPVSSVNYCELAETDAKFVHCLKSPSGYDEVMIRMTGGYDLATVEPFTGTISMKRNLLTASVDTPIAATPITGLMSEMTSDQQAQFLIDEGISGIVAASDFMDISNELAEGDRRKLLNLALKAHKVADIVATLLNAEFDQGIPSGNPEGGFFGVANGVPVDGSVYVYRAMVQQSTTTSNTLSAILSDVTLLEAVIERAKVEIDEGAIKQYNDKLPIDESTGEIASSETPLVAPATVSAAAHAALVIKVATTVDTVFTGALDETDNTTLSADILSRMRATDVVVSLTRNGEAANIVDNAVALASDSVYMTNLRAASTDMASLKKKFVASPGSIVAADADFSGRQPFSALLTGGGSPFTATTAGETVNDQGFAGNTLDLSKDPSDASAESVAIEFTGELGADGVADPAATAGTMQIAASSLGGDYATADGSDLVLDGTWTKVDDYTMIMNIEVTAGVYEPVIVKPNEDGTGYYFDLGGEQVVWQ